MPRPAILSLVLIVSALVLLACPQTVYAAKKSAADHTVVALGGRDGSTTNFCHVWDPVLARATLVQHRLVHDVRDTVRHILARLHWLGVRVWSAATDLFYLVYRWSPWTLPLPPYYYKRHETVVDDPILLSLRARERKQQIHDALAVLPTSRRTQAMDAQRALVDWARLAQSLTVDWLRQARPPHTHDTTLAARLWPSTATAAKQGYQRQVERPLLRKFHHMVASCRGTPLHDLYEDLRHETMSLASQRIDVGLDQIDDDTMIAQLVDLWQAAADQVTFKKKKKDTYQQAFKDACCHLFSLLRMVLYAIFSFLHY